MHKDSKMKFDRVEKNFKEEKDVRAVSRPLLFLPKFILITTLIACLILLLPCKFSGQEDIESKQNKSNNERRGYYTDTENNILTYYISKTESKLPDVRIEYYVQPLFVSARPVCIFPLTTILLQMYLGNPPARAAPEPRGPL